MRPQQKNRQRGRNQGGNNRRNQNPLTRSYESTGPDVKVRGNASQVADRYTQLARDAMSAGDRVMAENYLQHAEHYNRIIVAATAEQRQRDEREGRNRDDRDDQETGRNRDDRNDGRSDSRNDGRNESRNEGDERGRRRRRNRDNDQDRGDRNDRGDRGDRETAREDGSGVDASEAPQPDIQGTPAEVVHSRKAPTGESRGDDGAASEDGASESRARRTRRRRDADKPGETADAPAADPSADDEGVARTVKRRTRSTRRKAPEPDTAVAGEPAE